MRNEKKEIEGVWWSHTEESVERKGICEGDK